MPTKLDVLKDALTIAPENYKDNVRIISSLDDKAQKMGAIAGVFLGVLLALVKPDQLTSMLQLIGVTGVWLVTFVAVILMACIGLCLWCMWTRVLPPPLSLGHLTYITEAVDFAKPLDEERYLSERIGTWKKCISAQSQVAGSKQKRVFWAQVLLAGAMFLVALMLICLIHSVHPNPTPASVPVGNC